MRWGRYGAAGVLFVTSGSGSNGDYGGGEPLVMLQLRSGFAHEGGTWSCAGGALDHGETAFEGALREASEEVGVVPERIRLIGDYVFAPADDWTYTTVVVQVDQTFGRSMNFETEAVEWVGLEEVEQRPLHPGFASAWPHLRSIVERAGSHDEAHHLADRSGDQHCCGAPSGDA
ncbi:MAG: NUDIX hydrolase [Ilumatobacteraceae bacterium]